MHKYVTYNANRREKWVGHDHEISVTRSIRQMKNALVKRNGVDQSYRVYALAKRNGVDQSYRVYALDEDTWNMILIPPAMWHELFGVSFD